MLRSAAVARENVERLLSVAPPPPRPGAAFRRHLRARLAQESARSRRRVHAGRTAALAAAALLLATALGLVLLESPGPWVVAPPTGGPGGRLWVRHGTSAEGASWTPLRALPVRLLAGDSLATATESTVELTWGEFPGHTAPPDAVHLGEFPEGVHATVLLAGDSAFEVARTGRGGVAGELVRGAARVDSRPERPVTLTTPVVTARSCGARYRVVVHRNPPAFPVEREIAVNKKLTAGLAAGAILTVTIIVLNQSDAPVEVDRPDGGTSTLSPGESAVFDTDGGVQPVPSSAGDVAQDERPRRGDVVGEIPIDEEKVRIAGRVVDTRGHGVAGATIAFQRDEPGAEAPAVLAHVASAEDGAFELEITGTAAELAALSGRVEASKERYRPVVVPWRAEGDEAVSTPTAGGGTRPGGGEAAPEGNGEAARTTAPVEGSAESGAAGEGITIVLPSETAIAGRVHWPGELDEPPATEGSTLSPPALVCVQRYVDVYRRDEPVVRTFDAPDGGYYFGGIPPGKYRVWAYRQGFARSAPALVELADGEFLEGVDLILKRGTGLVGSVFSARTGKPVSGAIVYAHLDHLLGTVDILGRGDVDERVRNAVHTDVDGRFELDDITPGRTLIRVLHPEFAPRDEEVTLAAGTRPELEIELREGTGFRGQVLDEHNAPRTGDRVLAVTMTMDPERSVVTWGEVDDKGDYHIRNLQPGMYILVWIRMDADTMGDAEGAVQMSVLRTAEDTVVDFVETPTSAVVRGVVKGPDGEPRAGLTVTVMNSFDPVKSDASNWVFETDRTDADGRFEVRDVEPGEYGIGISPEQAQNFTLVRTFEIVELRDYDFEIVYHDLRIEGVLRTAQGEPLPNAELFVLEVGESGTSRDFRGRAVSGADGTYRVAGLLPGHYLLAARAEGYQFSGSPIVELKAGQKRPEKVDLELHRGAEITVRVLDVHAQPVPDARVWIRDASGEITNQSLHMETDDSGAYSYRSLAPGPHVVEIRLAGSDDPITREFTAAEGEPVELVIRLEP